MRVKNDRCLFTQGELTCERIYTRVVIDKITDPRNDDTPRVKLFCAATRCIKVAEKKIASCPWHTLLIKNASRSEFASRIPLFIAKVRILLSRGRGSGRPNSRPNYVGCYNEREVTGNKTCSFQTKRIAVSTFNLAREIGFRLFRKIIVFLFQTNLLDKFIQSHRFNSLDSGNTPPPLETHRKGRDSNHR